MAFTSLGSVRIELNHGGMDEMLKSGEVRGILRAKAEGVLAAAQAGAPVESGAYRDSLRVEETTAAALGISFKAGSNDRPAFVVVADVPYAMVVEANTGNMARAIDAAR